VTAKIAEPTRSPDSEKCRGADTDKFIAPLVMQTIRQPIISNLIITTHHEKF
jgi:hypothetical protein